MSLFNNRYKPTPLSEHTVVLKALDFDLVVCQYRGSGRSGHCGVSVASMAPGLYDGEHAFALRNVRTVPFSPMWR